LLKIRFKKLIGQNYKSIAKEIAFPYEIHAEGVPHLLCSYRENDFGHDFMQVFVMTFHRENDI